MLRVLSAPVLFALELTPACNNRCAGCPNVFGAEQEHDRPQQPPLDLADWQVVLNYLAPYARRLKFTGGEPTLHPDFFQIVEYAESLGLDFTLFTNGRWLEPLELVRTLSRLSHLTGLLISLHGAHAHSHEAFTGVSGSFEETVENICLALAAGLPATVSTVLTEPNLDEISDIVHLAEQLGINHVVFNRYLGPDVDGLTPSPSELACAVRQVEALRQEGHAVKFGNCIPQCFLPNESSGCLAGVAYCAIDPWGNVRPCTHSPLLAGNLLKQPLEEAWHAPAMEAFREAIAPQCHSCTAFSICHGGCKALAMEQHVDMDPLADPEQMPCGINLISLRFHPDLCPVSNFTVYPQEWGLALLGGNRVVAVKAAAAPLLRMMDGTIPLSVIEERFGPPGLSLVGTLYQRGLISLK